MPDLKDRMEKMLFDNETTYRTDFRGCEITPPTVTPHKDKPKCLCIRPPPLKDLHTLTPWKSKPAPFTLMHKPKAIDPTKLQEPYVKPPDEKLEETIRTRPRLVMTPAFSMDDIEDQRARKILCDNMYTSSMTKATREVPSQYFVVKAPLPGLPAPSNPITLPKLQLPYVAPEWRMDTVLWDKNQLRAYCDTSKEFWLRQELHPCRACRETEIIKANNKLYCQMNTGKRG